MMEMHGTGVKKINKNILVVVNLLFWVWNVRVWKSYLEGPCVKYSPTDRRGLAENVLGFLRQILDRSVEI
jgi:hypothetical protein